MRKLFSLLAVLVLAFSFTCTACAEGGIMPLSDPNSNVTSPSSLTYSANLSFKSYTNTASIKAPSDGKVTISLSDVKLSISKNISCSIKVRYWDGKYWQAAKISPKSFKVSGKKADYTFTASGLPEGSSFYVGLSKSVYKGYAVTGTIKVED